MKTELPVNGRCRLVRPRGVTQGFTLIELMIVIAIIGLLAAVVLAAVMGVFSATGDKKTASLFMDIQQAIPRWQQGEGKGDKLPKSGVNSLKTPFEGNRLLFKALVGDPESKGKKPYIELNEDYVGYVDASGQPTSSGSADRRVFVDGHGVPIVFWEWKSKTGRIMSDDPTEGGTGAAATPDELKLNKAKSGTFMLYSAGEDKKWGTIDDITIGGEKVMEKENPFPKPVD